MKKTQYMPAAEGPYTRLRVADICGHVTNGTRSYCKQCSPYEKQRRAMQTCVICAKQFEVKRSQLVQKRTCSGPCSSALKGQVRRGALSHWWRGGVSTANEVQRSSAAARQWREAVFSRDDHTCQMCHVRGGQLTADHIKPWSLYPALRFDLDNGRALCRPCHSSLPTSGWRLTNEIRREERKRGRLQYRLI